MVVLAVAGVAAGGAGVAGTEPAAVSCRVVYDGIELAAGVGDATRVLGLSGDVRWAMVGMRAVDDEVDSSDAGVLVGWGKRNCARRGGKMRCNS
jgi:hypothetical protein